MTIDAFYHGQTEQSAVKSEIVAKYFWAWAKVIIPWARKGPGKIGYIDLFAGPGVYQDGTVSTPLKILQRAINDSDMRMMLVASFNDANREHAASLEDAVAALPGIDTLRHPPVITNDCVTTGFSKFFEGKPSVPTLFFIDPWGYKGVSLHLIATLLSSWGCDCILFFNYNRIKISLTNPKVFEHMDALFGKERAEQLRRDLEKVPQDEKELTIIEAITEALQDTGAHYVLPFCFKDAHRRRTSHHLILATKHHRGYEIMKEIMAKESSGEIQGVPSFEYNPATRSQKVLFEYTRPVDELEDILLEEYAGTSVAMGEIYTHHNIGRRYIKSNYKDALISLERQGKIVTNPSAQKRPKRKGIPTFADTVVVHFPRRTR